jgi:DNA-binding MarR family transcriptional regulator
MTVTQAPPVPFGRHLGMAGRAGRALLDEVLIAETTTYETWITLNLLATGGPNVRRDDFARQLAAAFQDLDGAAIAQLLGQLESFGVIRTRPVPADSKVLQVELTAEGDARYQRVLAAVNRASGQVLASVDPDDLQTTIRVLGQFRERAEAMLAR